MLLSREGQSRVSVFVGPEASRLEQHAAAELCKYLHAISGAPFFVCRKKPATGTVAAIGRPETNPLVAEACQLGLVQMSKEALGEDGFLIRTLRLNGCDTLVLSGSHERSALYAVYAFLETALGVGFFRDGERIPYEPTIELPELAISERPRFRDRHDGGGCMFNYSALPWTLDNWKHELDWKVKHRVNMTCPFSLEAGVIDQVLAEWGVPHDPVLPPPYARLHEAAFEYARQLGLRMACPIPDARLPKSFLDIFPNARVLASDWSGLPATRRLHPSDPLFHRFVVDYVHHYEARYGTDHLYIANFLCEDRIVEGAGDRHQTWLDYAKAMSAALREADPDAVWLVDTWCFDMDAFAPEQRWSAEQVNEYLDAITVPIVVCDLWAEEAKKYKRTDYFGGKPWGFGVLHSFGGNSYLHGDMRDLIHLVQELDRPSHAQSCCSFIAMPEMVDFNPFYIELVARLSWNPSTVTLEGYVSEYCRRRYGAETGKALESMYWELLDSVYAPDSGSVIFLLDPIYWFRPRSDLYAGAARRKDKVLTLRQSRAAFIPKLRHAMEMLLSLPELLDANAMACHDLVDIARQWIAERFYQKLRLARDAFAQGNAPMFRRVAGLCLSLLDQQARLLASWPDYRLDRKIERSRTVFGDDACRAIKHTHVWVLSDEGQETLDLLDYYRLDLDGLVADYYKPRVAAYLDWLGRKLETGDRTLCDSDLDDVYSRIENEFVSAPVHRLPAGERPVTVARSLLADDDQGGGVLPENPSAAGHRDSWSVMLR